MKAYGGGQILPYDYSMYAFSIYVSYQEACANPTVPGPVVAGNADGAWAIAGIYDVAFGVGYSFDAITVHANNGKFDSGASGYGLAAAYDLGGGLSVHFGFGHSDPADTRS